MNKYNQFQNAIILIFLPVILFIGIFVCIGEEIYWFIKDRIK